MNTTTAVLALVTGVLTGALFASLRVPIPAPPTLPGVLGILGIFLGYRVVNALGVGFDAATLLP